MSETDTSAEAVERYDLYNNADFDGINYRAGMALNNVGGWVKHDDYLALLDAKDAVEAEASEALNQLDSARHSEECLKKRCEELWAEAAALRKAVQSAETATATGDGLTPDETMRLHQMLHAALNQPKEGDSDDG